MANNKGLMFEDEFVYYLNNRKVRGLSRHYRYVLEELFGFLDEEEIIYCQKTSLYIKPDIIITYRGDKKYLSIKKLGSETLHSENIKTFILFLRSLGISKRTQKTLLLFQYGDKTMDGTGEKRFNNIETLSFLDNRLEDTKIELNEQNIIIQILMRIIFDGVNPEAEKADAIYVGDGMNGYVATRWQMIKYLKRKSWKNWDALHIGPIIIRPHARYVDKPILNPEFRHRIDCYWPNLYDDIRYISKRFNSYTPIDKRKENK